MEKLDLTVIILTFNEELHIGRCIDNVALFSKEIVVIDCYSKDRTKDICLGKGVRFVQHQWPGNQATQFNWALENVSICTEWVLRIDADEYLSDDLIAELKLKLPSEPNDITGIQFKRKVFFQNRLMEHGPTVELLRLFRKKAGRSELRLMDEHIVLLEGSCKLYDNLFYDYNMKDIDEWIQKHLDYAKRNAVEFLNMKYGLIKSDNSYLEGQAAFKRKLKKLYFDFPLFIRPILYFIYRYIVKKSFLDGKEGFLWCFFQGWWYSTLVDARIWQINKACGKDKTKIVQYVKSHYNIEL